MLPPSSSSNQDFLYAANARSLGFICLIKTMVVMTTKFDSKRSYS